MINGDIKYNGMNKAINSGYSLVELIVVIGIIGVLLSVATINFGQWTKKSNIERQTRELYSDLNSARLNAIHTKKRHSIILNPNGYVLKNYSSENESSSAGRILQTKTVSYQLTGKSSSGSALTFSNSSYEFNTRGFLSNYYTIIVNPINSGASFDCIVVHVARTNMGKMTNANTCTY